jgi:hypothetical protein
MEIRVTTETYVKRSSGGLSSPRSSYRMSGRFRGTDYMESLQKSFAAIRHGAACGLADAAGISAIQEG